MHHSTMPCLPQVGAFEEVCKQTLPPQKVMRGTGSALWRRGNWWGTLVATSLPCPRVRVHWRYEYEFEVVIEMDTGASMAKSTFKGLWLEGTLQIQNQFLLWVVYRWPIQVRLHHHDYWLSKVMGLLTENLERYTLHSKCCCRSFWNSMKNLGIFHGHLGKLNGWGLG